VDWANFKRPDIYEGRSSLDTNPDWDAWTWAAHARLEGLRVDETPEVGAVVVWPESFGEPGHVAYVEASDSEGDGGLGTITVSEMNSQGLPEEDDRWEGATEYYVVEIEDPQGYNFQYIHQR
jgi:surface antigen